MTDVYQNFNRTQLDAFVRSALDARDELVQYKIFWSCAPGRRLKLNLPQNLNTVAYGPLPIYPLRWVQARYPDYGGNYACDLNNAHELGTTNVNSENTNPYWPDQADGIWPTEMVSDTDPIRFRVWAYEIRGRTGDPIIIQIDWGKVPPPQAFAGLVPFRGRLEVSGYSVGLTPTPRTPTITGEMYAGSYRYGRSIVDELMLAWEVTGPITFTGGGGTGAAAHVEYTSTGNISRIVLDEPGDGYVTEPLVGGARARAKIAAGKVTEVQLLGNRNSDIKPWIVDSQQTPIIGFGVGKIALVSVVNGGSGYITAPEVKFIGGGGTGARAHATVANGSVKEIIVDDGGQDYTDVPLIVVGSGMTGTFPAVAQCSLTFKVTGLRSRKSGLGYTSAPSVTITGGGGTGAAAHAVLAGAITGITITAPGSGYIVGPPAVIFTGGGGTGAAAQAIMTGDHVSSIRILDGGSGYTSAPTISFSPVTAHPAAATATFTLNTAISLVLDAQGSGYTSSPKVDIAPPPPGGTPALADAVIGNSTIATVSVTYSGEGYITPPAVSFNGGGGNGDLHAHSVIDGQGRVTAVIVDTPGTNYTSTPEVKFDNVNPATALAILDTLYESFGLSGYSLTNRTNHVGIELDEFNDGCNNGQFWGFGFNGAIFADALDADKYADPYYIADLGAYAEAVMTLVGHIDSVSIINAGRGYGKAPQITFYIFEDPNPDPAAPPVVYTAPTAKAEIENGSISRIFITDQGEGYFGVAIIIPPPEFKRATAVTEITGVVGSIVLDNRGSGYTGETADVTIDGNARATAVVENGQVVRINLDDPGSGYKANPSVKIAGNAKAHAVLNASVSKITITNPGLGYVDAPRVRFVYGDATAEADIERTNGTVSALRITDGGSGYTEAPIVFLEIPDPLEVQKPTSEKVKLFALLVPGGYDINHNFIPNLNAGKLPGFWLDGEITGNTYYNYWAAGVGLQSNEVLDVKCAEPWTFYGESETVNAYLIPPSPVFGLTDAYGHLVQGGDFWWFAGPSSGLGGEEGFGPYTVAAPPSQPFYTFEYAIPCPAWGGTAWYIFWDYSVSQGQVGIGYSEVGTPLHPINNVICYFITSTHSPRHLKRVDTIPNSNQVFGRLPVGNHWNQINITEWVVHVFVDEVANFRPVLHAYPPVVPGELINEGGDDDIPAYYFPLTYGKHNQQYIAYFYNGLNLVARCGATSFAEAVTNDDGVMIDFQDMAAVADLWTQVQKTFVPILAQITADTRSDMSLLVSGIIEGGMPYFGAAYRSRDINFHIASQVFTAKAVATVEGGEVVAITITDHGSGYIGELSPQVRIVGGGGQGAEAVISDIAFGTYINTITLLSGGSGYTSVPDVIIDEPLGNTFSGWLPMKPASRP